MNATHVVAGVLCLALLLVLMRLANGAAPRLRLRKRPLMTATERETLCFLEAAVPHCRVYPQVAMGALLRPEPGLSRKEYGSLRGRFSQKIVDYVLESRASGEVIALVELDDRTHSAEKDARRDALTAAAGYLTIRLPGDERPTLANVRHRVTAAIAASVTAPAVGAGRSTTRTRSVQA